MWALELSRPQQSLFTNWLYQWGSSEWEENIPSGAKGALCGQHETFFWSMPEMCLLSVTYTNSVSSMEIGKRCRFCVSEQLFRPDSTQRQTQGVSTPPNKLGESGRDGLRPSYLSSHCIFLKFMGLVWTSTVPRSGPKGKIEPAYTSASQHFSSFPSHKGGILHPLTDRDRRRGCERNQTP